jgi:predicted lipoprotein with Yx(FWY)xxD motif
LGCAALVLGIASLPSNAGASNAGFRAKISILSTSDYGTVLVVGSGRLKGAPLYVFSGDEGGTIRCGTTQAKGFDLGPVASAPLTCTGPEADLLAGVKTDDWPAFTSAGRPVVGSGVSQRLLGTVTRKGIGRQVTYDGRPLYLFDPASTPFTPQGEGYVETVKPLAPWHGYWSLVSPAGTDAPGRVRLEAGTLPDSSRALSVVMDVNVMPFDETVYTFSRLGTQQACSGSCSLTWVPVLTSNPPLVGAGVNSQTVGERTLANGTEQVTYDGRPLFLYAKEKVFLTPTFHIKSSGTAGNGAGTPAPGGGTFVTIPLS